MIWLEELTLHEWCKENKIECQCITCMGKEDLKNE
tara:strand:- start:57 stop:161 length:105 start_codon:yes stop_codon:yes gene_type:complete